MDLFEQRRHQLIETEAPLAARMRPQTLDQFIGQDAIIGPGRLLRRAIQADQLSSVIFYGPPGTGKTTLAQIVANTTQACFIPINAVLAGVKEIRAAIESAQQNLGLYSRRTILFVDEVHRFNKAQQDALLPWVENGTVVLIGATTENPYFEVNKALVSRSRIFRLQSLTAKDLHCIASQALADSERGYGNRSVQVEAAALGHLVNVANGDARALLNALELAVETTEPSDEGTIHLTLAVAEESIQRRAVLYDKEGDAHFDTISAFIKSLRGSDPDAALYWLARMIYAGEDPRYIFRRMSILASEDVGLADPQAVIVVNACAASFDRVGLPEGHYPLAQAALYLATAPKSNSVMGFFDALAVVEREQQAEVPTHLKDGNRDKQQFGHGVGYRYPHAYREHWVAQQYLPSTLQGQVFYQPSDQGVEAVNGPDVVRRREAQLAALMVGQGAEPQEGLTYGPEDPATERWLQRTLGQTGDRLSKVRDRIFTLAQPQRHHVILDLNAGNGLLTWEALRQVPEGGVYACVRTAAEATALQEQAAVLPDLLHPVILQTPLVELSAQMSAQASALRCDRILGYNTLTHEPDKAIAISVMAELLSPDGLLVLAETIPRHTQRLYRLLDFNRIDPNLYQRLTAAEESIYADPCDPMVNWDAETLQNIFETANLVATLHTECTNTPTYLSSNLLERWFAPTAKRPTYASRLSNLLSNSEIASIRTLFFQQLANQSVNWENTTVFIQAHLSSVWI